MATIYLPGCGKHVQLRALSRVQNKERARYIRQENTHSMDATMAALSPASMDADRSTALESIAAKRRELEAIQDEFEAYMEACLGSLYPGLLETLTDARDYSLLVNATVQYTNGTPEKDIEKNFSTSTPTGTAPNA